MCSCTSCKHTDSFSGWKTEDGKTVPDPKKGGFDRWPKGEPAGQRSSESAYRAHVAHSRSGETVREVPAFKISPEPHFSMAGLVGPLPSPSATVRDWIASSYAWADGRNVFPGRSVQPVRKSTRPRLIELARELRRAA